MNVAGRSVYTPRSRSPSKFPILRKRALRSTDGSRKGPSVSRRATGLHAPLYHARARKRHTSIMARPSRGSRISAPVLGVVSADKKCLGSIESGRYSKWTEMRDIGTVDGSGALACPLQRLRVRELQVIGVSFAISRDWQVRHVDFSTLCFPSKICCRAQRPDMPGTSSYIATQSCRDPSILAERTALGTGRTIRADARPCSRPLQSVPER